MQEEEEEEEEEEKPYDKQEQNEEQALHPIEWKGSFDDFCGSLDNLHGVRINCYTMLPNTLLFPYSKLHKSEPSPGCTEAIISID